jgi:hypothetical protein
VHVDYILAQQHQMHAEQYMLYSADHQLCASSGPLKNTAGLSLFHKLSKLPCFLI